MDQPPFPTEALRTRARYDHARRDHCTQPEREAPDDLASGDCARRVVYDTSSSVPPKASEHSAHSTVVLRHPIKNAYSKRPQDSSITSAAPLDLEVDVEREQDGHHDAAQQHAHALHREDLGPPLETALLEVLERAGLGDLEPALRRQGVLTVDDLAWKSGVQVMRLTGLERPHAQSLKRLAEDVAVERQNAALPEEEHDEL